MTFQKFIGASISEYCRQQYPELVQVHRWTTQTIRKALEDFWERTGRPPLLKELVKENKLPCRSVIQRAAGMPPATFIRDWYMETHALSTREGSPGIHQRNRKWDRPEWTEENIRNAFEAFIEDHARLPHTTEVRSKNGLPSIGTILKQTGTVSYPDFCRKYFPHMSVWSRTRWDRDSCIRVIDQFIQEHGRLPRVKETHSYGLPNYNTFQNLVGESFPAYFKRLYPDLDEHRDKWTMDRICEALDDFVQREGRPPQAAELCKENELPSQPIIKRMTGMTASTFIHEWYAENYGITEQEESIGWSMQMM